MFNEFTLIGSFIAALSTFLVYRMLKRLKSDRIYYSIPIIMYVGVMFPFYADYLYSLEISYINYIDETKELNKIFYCLSAIIYMIDIGSIMFFILPDGKSMSDAI
jgi:hypothetical protein